MVTEMWLDRLAMLVVRFAKLGIAGDLSSLNRDEQWALYRRLSRLKQEEAHGQPEDS